MAWFERFTFWRRDRDGDGGNVADADIEKVEGFDVDGCFTLPDARLPDPSPPEGTDHNNEEGLGMPKKG